MFSTRVTTWPTLNLKQDITAYTIDAVTPSLQFKELQVGTGMH